MEGRRSGVKGKKNLSKADTAAATEGLKDWYEKNESTPHLLYAAIDVAQALGVATESVERLQVGMVNEGVIIHGRDGRYRLAERTDYP